MLSDHVNPISKVSARDLLVGYLAGIDELPMPDGAARIAETLRTQGTFVRPEYLLDVWTQEGGAQCPGTCGG